MPAKFRRVGKNLKKRNIHWHPDRGSGSHGMFIGLDGAGNSQSYPIPKSDQYEMNDCYVSGLARRFDIDVADLKD